MCCVCTSSNIGCVCVFVICRIRVNLELSNVCCVVCKFRTCVVLMVCNTCTHHEWSSMCCVVVSCLDMCGV